MGQVDSNMSDSGPQPRLVRQLIASATQLLRLNEFRNPGRKMQVGAPNLNTSWGRESGTGYRVRLPGCRIGLDRGRVIPNLRSLVPSPCVTRAR